MKDQDISIGDKEFEFLANGFWVRGNEHYEERILQHGDIYIVAVQVGSLTVSINSDDNTYAEIGEALKRAWAQMRVVLISKAIEKTGKDLRNDARYYASFILASEELLAMKAEGLGA